MRQHTTHGSKFIISRSLSVRISPPPPSHSSPPLFYVHALPSLSSLNSCLLGLFATRSYLSTPYVSLMLLWFAFLLQASPSPSPLSGSFARSHHHPTSASELDTTTRVLSVLVHRTRNPSVKEVLGRKTLGLAFVKFKFSVSLFSPWPRVRGKHIEVHV